MPMRTAIALFTRDLRAHDNPVLRTAADTAERVIPLFVLDKAITSSGFAGPNRAEFLPRSLSSLDCSLRERGAALVVRRGEPIAELGRLVAEHGVTDVHVAADVSGYARRRQDGLIAELNTRVHVHDTALTVAAPGSLTPSGGGDHFAVFTPYLRRWLEATSRAPLSPPGRLYMPPVAPGTVPVAAEICAGATAPDLAEGGEHAARARLAEWTADEVDDYPDGHDDLAGDRTSRLSPHLHFGTLSPTEVVSRVGSHTQGAREFVRQLAWRDFHHQVLAARPHTATADYRPRGDRWRIAPEELQAWREGRTGYPIVDAGMRQLLREGWMHNRARMITASFLTKTLYLDWREGARHSCGIWSTGTWRTTSSTGSGWRAPAPTPGRTACSTRCVKPNDTTRRVRTCAGTYPSCVMSRTERYTAPGRSRRPNAPHSTTRTHWSNWMPDAHGFSPPGPASRPVRAPRSVNTEDDGDDVSGWRPGNLDRTNAGARGCCRVL